MTPTDLETRTMIDIAAWATEIAQGRDGPTFTAAVILDGTVIARARNEVAETGDPTRHAEVVAIAKAAMARGDRDLSGATLLASCQPCEMCLAAMRWAGISRLVFAARQENVAPRMFRFPALTIADYHAACDGAFTFAGGVCEDMVLHIYQDD